MATKLPYSSRKRRIPGTQVLDWQIGPKATIRRPPTACEACRIAKAKCTGKRTCDRCNSKGIRCVPAKINSNGSSLSSQLEYHDIYATDANAPPEKMTTEAMNIDFSAGVDIPYDAFNTALQELDWIFQDDSLPNTTSDGVAPQQLQKGFSQHATTAELPLLSSTDSQQQAHTSHRPSQRCDCRSDIVKHVHRLDCITSSHDEKSRTDNMFQVTGQVIAGCYSAIKCSMCYISPVDLVQILTVFQQTAYCLKQISQSGLSNDGEAFTIGVGDYQVCLKDAAAVKSMLVLDLVTQAERLLDATTSKANELSQIPLRREHRAMRRSPICLDQLNLDYVKQVTTKFKQLFQLIREAFEEKKGQN